MVCSTAPLLTWIRVFMDNVELFDGNPAAKKEAAPKHSEGNTVQH